VPTESTASTQLSVAERRSAWPAVWSIVLAVAVLAFVTADVRYGGPLSRLDVSVGRRLQRWDLRHHVAAELPLRALVLFGQRGVVGPAALVFFGWLSWRGRTSEPLVRLVAGLIVISVVVYAVKFTVPRPAPLGYFTIGADAPGRSYPSGHMANGIGLWGLALFGALRWRLPDRAVRVAAVARWVAPIAIAVGMTLLNYHWITDFLAGAAAGVLALAAGVAPAWTRFAERLDHRVGAGRGPSPAA
jgi:membrane-associated phospholipid phosphatase